MDFVTAIKTCLGKYATFKGRASRSEFWYWTLFTWLLSVAAMLVDSAMGGGVSATEPGIQVVSTIVMLAIWMPTLGVSVRRLHDVNRTGWWVLLALTVLGAVVLLYWFVMPSKDANNRYNEYGIVGA